MSEALPAFNTHFSQEITMKRFVILLEDTEAERLEKYCTEHGSGVFGYRQWVLRESIREFLDRNLIPEPVNATNFA